MGGSNLGSAAHSQMRFRRAQAETYGESIADSNGPGLLDFASRHDAAGCDAGRVAGRCQRPHLLLRAVWPPDRPAAYRPGFSEHFERLFRAGAHFYRRDDARVRSHELPAAGRLPGIGRPGIAGAIQRQWLDRRDSPVGEFLLSRDQCFARELFRHGDFPHRAAFRRRVARLRRSRAATHHESFRQHAREAARVAILRYAAPAGSCGARGRGQALLRARRAGRDPRFRSGACRRPARSQSAGRQHDRHAGSANVLLHDQARLAPQGQGSADGGGDRRAILEGADFRALRQ